MKLVILTAQIGHYHDARYRALAAAGSDVTVVATQNEADFAEFMAVETGGYPAQRLFEGREAYRHAAVEGRVWPAVQRKLAALDPAVIAVAGWATPESFAAIAWARRHRRRLAMLSASQRTDAARSRWREWVKARVVGHCDAALVGGPSHLDYIAALGIPRDRAFMGYDAVDNAHFAAGADAARADAEATRARLGMPGRYFLASARFIPKKNLLRLVRAYAMTLKNRPDVPDLVILGDGPERGAVEAAIAAAGLVERVHLPGFCGYADLPALYGLSDGFVHVSTSEQWGLVINEAAASGVAAIASSACGATPSLVRDGVNGFVVDALDERSIAAALADLVELSRDRRLEMGAASRRIVADWGPERFASGLLSACDSARACPARGLAPWDHALLRFLAGQSIATVE